jgi:uncharacterized protein with PQ loop repeat
MNAYTVGILAVLFTIAANIPLDYVIIRGQSTEHISVSTYFILLTGTLLWGQLGNSERRLSTYYNQLSYEFNEHHNYYPLLLFQKSNR